MKYFAIEGESLEELKKKIAREYGGNLLVFKFTTEEIPQTAQAEGMLKKFRKSRQVMKKVHKAYCGLPETPQDLEQFERNRKMVSPKKEVLPVKSEEALLGAVSAGEQEDVALLRREMEELKALFSRFIGSKVEESQNREEEKILSEARQFMLKNDFSLEFSDRFLGSLHFPVEGVETFRLILREKIRHNIRISGGFAEGGERFILLLGPTGVGKTTTLAKLASIYFFQKQRKIRFVTFDSYRLGASKQLEQYARVFEQPFHLVQTQEELDAILKAVGKDEVIFMDTAGESLKKEVKLSEVEEFLKRIPEKIIKVLTLSANSKASDLAKIKQKFKRFSYDYYIITKMDETITFGPILETLYKDPVSVAYVTDGQEVPENIREAVLEDFLSFN